jgi:Mce-associated membrane protein
VVTKRRRSAAPARPVRVAGIGRPVVQREEPTHGAATESADAPAPEEAIVDGRDDVAVPDRAEEHDGCDQSTADEQRADEVPATRIWPPTTPVVLVLAAAVLAGLGTFFLVQGEAAGEASENTALLDVGATTEVTGQVKDAVEKIFSYSYDNVETTRAIAAEVLADDAVRDYEALLGQVSQRAPEQKLVLSTRVVDSGVRSLHGDTAQLLLFLDQVATRVDTNKSTSSAAVLSITAQRRDGVWKITDLVPR